MSARTWAGGLIAASICSVLLVSPLTHAQDPKSNNFRFDESSIGTGGLFDSSSANFRANSSTGDTAIGNSTSDNFQVDSGTKTQRDPTLSFVVDAPLSQFGKFSPTIPATATSTFKVSNYTSFGYIVQVYGAGPSNGQHTIASMEIPGTSQPGIEQFGINLVANTSPRSFGANPDNGQFGFGAVTAEYNVSNQFRYTNGGTVARAEKSSGETTYTISYLVNVSSLTPGGQYAARQTLVVTGTY